MCARQWWEDPGVGHSEQGARVEERIPHAGWRHQGHLLGSRQHQAGPVWRGPGEVHTHVD